MFKKRRDINLKDNHWTLDDLFVATLKQFVTATDILSNEEFPISSGMYPLVFGLINKHLVVLEVHTNVIAEMKNAISDGLRSRLLKDDFWLSPPMITTARGKRTCGSSPTSRVTIRLNSQNHPILLSLFSRPSVEET